MVSLMDRSIEQALDARYLQAYRDLQEGLPLDQAAARLDVSLATARAIRSGRQARIRRLLAKGHRQPMRWS